jgi:hypothetical protein
MEVMVSFAPLPLHIGAVPQLSVIQRNKRTVQLTASYLQASLEHLIMRSEVFTAVRMMMIFF